MALPSQPDIGIMLIVGWGYRYITKSRLRAESNRYPPHAFGLREGLNIRDRIGTPLSWKTGRYLSKDSTSANKFSIYLPPLQGLAQRGFYMYKELQKHLPRIR